jgi:hypothetical protein
MNTRILPAVVAATFGFAAVAHAATISSPAIFGSHAQDRATCVVLNTGAQPVQVTLRILDESGGTVHSGTGVVQPGQFIVLMFGINFGVAYACNATAATVGTLSGALTISEEVDDGFGGEHHRAIRSAPLR